MKKFLPYILILTIIVQLFAPFGFGVGKNKLINKNVAIAASIDENNLNAISNALRQKVKIDCLDSNLPLKNFCVAAAGLNDGQNKSSSLFIYLLGQRPVKSPDNTPIITLTITDDLGNIVSADNDLEQWSINQDQGLINKNDPDKTKYDGYIFGVDKINGLTKDRKYSVKIEVLKGVINPSVSYTVDGIYISEDGTQTTTNTTAGSGTKNDSGFLPACNPINGYLWSGEGTFMGCVVQLFYYVLFVPTSYLFALTGSFLDAVFHFSIQDESYRTPFVTEGWKLIRDFCNMFFIFILLYIAFGTILKIHSVKTQEMIINVIIIGLLINFSLFACQVIIDASNILARVFYDSDTIRITGKGANGVANATPGLKIGPNGEIPISAAIVNKVNPQNLIINGKDAVRINDKLVGSGDINSTEEAGGLSTGSWIVIILLASIVNIVGIISFLSAGLIFVSRVIGLWFSMILAPLAFFSYIVPQLRSAKMIGWEKWWPDTLKLAFLAPIFTFFMYIIIMFLDKGLSLVSSNKSTDGLTFVISIIIPFVFIMFLLMKAKDIAKDMSGELGQSITKVIAAAGGVALGAGALGVAALGRRTVGQTMAKASRGDTATQKYEAAKGNPQLMSQLSKWDKLKGAVGSKATLGLLGKAYGKTTINQTTGEKTVTGGIGKYMNEKQKDVNGIEHARHEMDEAKKAAGLEGIDDKKLSGEDQKKVEKVFNKNKKSEVEANIRRGDDGKGNDIMIQDPNNPNKSYKGEESYKAARRHDVMLDVHNAAESGDIDYTTNELTDAGKKKVENRLNAEFNIALKNTTESELRKTFEHIRDESRKNISMLSRGVSGSNKASFDFRNLSQIKSDKRDGIFSKIPTTLIAGVASGVRVGLKNGMNIEHGTGQKDLIRDLSNTLSNALKELKVDVKIDTGHSGGGHEKTSGGHGGGHH